MISNFNTDLAAPESWEQDKGIASALAEEGIEYMSGYFLSRNTPWLKDGCTWAMHRGVHEVHSRTYHILGTDSHLLQNVVVRGTRHNTDH